MAEKAKVYFTEEISPKAASKLFDLVRGDRIKGRVAFKVHTGEKGNFNFIRPEFWKDIISKFDAKVIECNTAYEGARNSTEKHMALIKEHGWTDLYDMDIMDAEAEDIRLEIPDGFVIKENFVGGNLKNYDSFAVLSHFKGHPMGGYGGALKQLSIGFASTCRQILHPFRRSYQRPVRNVAEAPEAGRFHLCHVGCRRKCCKTFQK